MNRLKKISLRGYKSIRDQSLEFGPLNVLIGANGAGKSNFISLFKMLNYMLSDSLQIYIAGSGGANSLLYYGSKLTPQMECELEFQAEKATDTYHMRLSDASPDTLIFTEEQISYHSEGYAKPRKITFDSGRKETQLNEYADNGDITAVVVRKILRGCLVFQFHDTSQSAYIRKMSRIADNSYLRSDAGNLSAFLYMLKRTRPENYRRIEDIVRKAVPQFGGFVLEESKLYKQSIQLEWKERDSEYPFGPHQISDGLLRFIALTTLILQPEESIPEVIIIDEPELGLHPYAIGLLANMLKQASEKSQVILATQSATLLDNFDADDVVIVNRNGKESTFKRLTEDELDVWKEEYTLGELWQKNIFEGRPNL